MNDYVEVQNGQIINLAFELGLYIDKEFPQSQIIAEAISKVQDYFDIDKWDMGQNIYMSQLIEDINNVGGVLNVMELKVFNKVGDGYSLNQIAQPLLDDATREIDLAPNYALMGSPISMFELKRPSVDIRVRVKTN